MIIVTIKKILNDKQCNIMIYDIVLIKLFSISFKELMTGHILMNRFIIAIAFNN